jgi:hypothetical protein
MKLIKVVVLAFLTVCLGTAAATESACHEHVCGDHLMFCLAGCTSSSPSSCRTDCYSDYDSCTQCSLLENSTRLPSGHTGRGNRGFTPVGHPTH